MSSIDERIVKLEFDNRLFEKNAQTSIGTLEKLKQALKLDDASKSLDALEKSMAGQNSLGNIEKSLDKIKDRFSTGGIIGMRVIQNLTDGAMRLGKQLLQAVDAPLQQIKSGGWTRALNIQQAQFQIQALNGDWETLKENINAAVKGTAYGFDEAAKVAAMLTASGVEAGEKMQDTLLGISGAAAMTGGSYAEIGDIFATVAGNGKLMTEQLRQFSFRGLNVAATMAEQLGVTESELRQMVTDGKISFEMFATAMNQAFGESATKANELFTGALANTKAALSRIGADVAGRSMNNFRDVLNKTREVVDQFHVALGTEDSGLLGDINTFVERVSKGVIGILDSPAFSQGVQTFANGLREGFGIFTDWYDKFIEIMKLRKIDGGEIFLGMAQGFEKFVTSIRSNTSLATDVYHIFGGISTIIKQIVGFVGEFAGGVAKFFSTLQVLRIANNLIKSFKNILVGVRSVLEPVGRAFMNVFGNINFHPLTEAARFLKDFTKQLRLSEDQAAAVEAVFTKVFGAIKVVTDGIGTVVGGVASTIGKAITSIFPFGIKMESGTKKIEERFGSLESTVKTKVFGMRDSSATFGEVFASVSEKVKNAIVSMGEKMGINKDTFTNALDKIKEKASKLDVSGFSAKVKDTAGKLFDYLKGLFTSAYEYLDNLSGGNLFDKIKAGVAKVVEYVEKAFKVVTDYFKGLDLKSPLDLFTKLGEKITGVGKLIGEFWKKLTSGDKAGTFLSKTGSGLTDFFDLLGKGLSKTGELIGKVLGGGAEGLGYVLEGIFKILGTVIGKLADFIGQLDLAKVAAMGSVAALGAISLGIFQALRGISDLTSGVGSLAEAAGGALESIFGAKKPSKLLNLANSIKTVAIAIGIMSAALFVLSKIPMKELIPGMVGLAGIVAAIVILEVAMSKLSKSIKANDSVKEFAALSTAIPLIAISLFTITSALKNLNEVDTSGLGWKVLAVAGVLTAVAVCARILSGMNGDVKTSIGQAVSVLLFATAIDNIVKAFIRLTKIDLDATIDSLKKVAIVLGTAGTVAFALSKVSFGKGAGLLLGVAAIELLVRVIENIGSKNWGSMAGNIATFGAIVGGFAIVVGGIALAIKGIEKLAGLNDSLKGVKDLGIAMFAVAASAYILGLAIEKIGSLDTSSMWRAGLVIAGMVVVLVGFTKFAKFQKDVDYKGTALMFLGLATAIGIIAGSITMLSMLDDKALIKGTAAVGALILLMGVFARLSSTKNSIDMKGILAIGGVVTVLSLIVMAFSLQSWDGIIRGFTAMGVAMAEFVVLFGFIKLLSKNGITKAQGVMIAAVALSLVAIAVALKLLAGQPWEAILSSGAAISGVLLSYAATFKILNGMAEDWKQAAVTAGLILVGVGSIAAIAGAMYVLTQNPWESIAAAGAGISVMLLSLAGSMKLINTMADDATTAAVTGGMLIAGAVAIAGIALALTPLTSNPWESIAAACVGISAVLLALSGSFAILTFMSPSIGEAITAVGMLIGGAVAIALLVQALLPLVKQPYDNIIAACNGVADVLRTLGIVFGIFGVVFGSNIAAVGVACAALIGAVVSLWGAIEAVGALANWADKDGKILQRGLDTLGAIGEGIGRAIGRFVAGIAEAIADSLPTIGTRLSEFAINIQPFIDSINALDRKSVKSAQILADTIMTLTQSSLLDSITNLITLGHGGLNNFGETATALGNGVKAFADSVKDLSSKTIEKVEMATKAAKQIAKFAEAVPKEGGIWQGIVGENGFASFAETLANSHIGKSIATFAEEVKDVDENDIKKGAAAGKMIASFADAVPNTGGALAAWVGDNSLSDFAKQLTDGEVHIGAAIATFASEVASISEEDVSKAQAAGEMITGFANAIPNTGGILADWVGDNSLSNFAGAIMDNSNGATIGEAISQFVSSISNVTKKDIANAEAAGGVIVTFCTQVRDAKFSTGKWGRSLQTDLTNFANAITESNVGGAIKTFVDQVKNVSKNSVEKAGDAGAVIVALATSVKEANFDSTIETKLTNFSNAVTNSDIGNAIKTFMNSVKYIGKDSAQKAADAGAVIVAFAQSINEGGFQSGWLQDTLTDKFNTITDAFTATTNGKTIGQAISSFTLSVGGVREQAITNSQSAGAAAVAFATKLESLGDIDTGNFAVLRLAFTKETEGKTIGQAIMSFLQSIGGVSEETVKRAQNAGAAANAFMAEITSIDLVDISSIVRATQALTMETGGKTIGNAIKSFTAEIGTALTDDAVKRARTAANIVVAYISRINALESVDVAKFGKVQSVFTRVIKGKTIGQAAMSFFLSIGGVSEETLSRANSVAKAAVGFINSINTGIKEDIDTTKFTRTTVALTMNYNGKTLGQAISSLMLSLGGVREAAITNAQTAADALIAFVNGVNSIDELNTTNFVLITQMLTNYVGGKTIGEAIQAFIQSIGGVNESAVTNAQTAADVASSFINGINDIDSVNTANFAGIIGVLTGTVKGKNIGQAISSLILSLGGVNSSAITNAENAATVASTFINGINGIDDINVQTFANVIGVLTATVEGKTIGQAINSFLLQISGVKDNAVDKAQKAATGVNDILDTLGKVADKDLSSITSGLDEFGIAIKDFCERVKSIDTDALSGFGTAFSSAITQMGGDAMNTAIEALNTAAEKFITVGETITGKVGEGMTTDAATLTVNVAGTALGKAATTAIQSESNYSLFQKAGEYLVGGFIKGLSGETQLAAITSAGQKLASTAANAINNANVTITKGSNLSNQLISGIQSKSTEVQNAGGGIVKTAAKSAKKEAEVFKKEHVGKQIVIDTANDIKYEENFITDAIHTVGNKANEASNGELGKLKDSAQAKLHDFGQTVTNEIPGVSDFANALGGSGTAATGGESVASAGEKAATGLDKATTATDKHTESTKKAAEATQKQISVMDYAAAAVEDYHRRYVYIDQDMEHTAQDHQIAEQAIYHLGEQLLATKQKSSEASESVSSDSEKTKSHAEEVRDAFLETQQSIQSTIDSQVDWFAKVEEQEEISKEELIKNMADQKKVLNEWWADLNILSERGISQGLYQHLAEMGPEGLKYVRAFVDMNDKELQNYSKSWDHNTNVSEKISAKLMADMAALGKDAIVSFANGVSTSSPEVTQKSESVGKDAVTGLQTGINSGAAETGQDAHALGASIVTSLAAGITEDTQPAMDAINTFATQLTETIAAAVAQFNETETVHILQGFIDGIEDDQRTMFQKLQETFTKVDVDVKAFAAKFKPAGEAAMEGYANGVKAKKAKVEDAIHVVIRTVKNIILSYQTLYNQLGEFITKGIAVGMVSESALEWIGQAAAIIVQYIINSFSQEADEHSPSRKAMPLGEFFTKGIAEGMASREAINAIGDAAATVVESALNAFDDLNAGKTLVVDAVSDIDALDHMNQAIDKISKVLNDELDPNPVIVPLLDLSQVEREARNINNMFDAINIPALSGNGDSDSTNQNQNRGTTFIQNNYSPKALSRLEIYRDTSNLFAMAKDRVNA